MNSLEKGTVPKNNWQAYFRWIMGALVLVFIGWGLFKGSSFLAQTFWPNQPRNTSVALSAGFVRPEPEATVKKSLPGEALAPKPTEPGSSIDSTVPAAAVPIVKTDKSSQPRDPAPVGREGTSATKVFEIRGSVQRGGKPIYPGKVRLTVSIVGERFRQSVLTDLNEKGEFTVRNASAFQGFTKKHGLCVLAEVWPATGLSSISEPLTETVYLNHPLPSWFRNSSGYGALGGLLLLLSFFLWAFTGRSTYTKNRFAIILSYCVILLSLAGSLIIPTLLMLAVPELPEISGKVPVGLFVSHLTKESKNPQWMLNIGGYVESDEEQGEPSKSDTLLQGRSVEEDDLSAPALRVVTLNGGIQIPLYVIILALIGGAINMTRQVPNFQSREEQNNKDEMDNSWRKGLLEQYMFLIAAPFLAIATYYLLILLGTIQPPIIVLVCFSIGLISDTVVNAITEAAKKLLGGKQPAGQPTPAQPAPEPNTLREVPSRDPVKDPKKDAENDPAKPQKAA